MKWSNIFHERPITTFSKGPYSDSICPQDVLDDLLNSIESEFRQALPFREFFCFCYPSKRTSSTVHTLQPVDIICGHRSSTQLQKISFFCWGQYISHAIKILTETGVERTRLTNTSSVKKDIGMATLYLPIVNHYTLNPTKEKQNCCQGVISRNAQSHKTGLYLLKVTSK